MPGRPAPLLLALAVGGVLLGAACAMASQSVALAADGAFQLAQVLGDGDVYGSHARILAAYVHQAAVVLALRADVTDTHVLSVLLGVGQLVVPAIVWSLAVVVSRQDRLVFAAVAMTAGVCAGTTWFVSVSESVLAVPLTVLVAVLLWWPETWRWRQAALAAAASAILVASYETAVVTGAALAAWASWRAARATSRLDRYGSGLVAALSALSVVVGLAGTASGRNPTHSRSLLYFVVSLEPWPFYLALAGIAVLLVALGPWLDGSARWVALGSGCAVVLVALSNLEATAFTGFAARGGIAVAGFALQLFLWWRWLDRRAPAGDRELPDWLLAVPALVVVAAMAASVRGLDDWSRSLDSFRREVDAAPGVVDVLDVLPPGRRAVLWGWTSSSLSLIVRGDAHAGVLVDHDPVIVPFPPSAARAQLSDEYTWGR